LAALALLVVQFLDTSRHVIGMEALENEAVAAVVV
jgi:hypothetical protein